MIVSDLGIRCSESHASPPANATVNKNDASACGRPDCDWPGEASNDNEDYFVVEKVLGRSVSSDSGEERNYLWLIKWSGYVFQLLPPLR